MPIPVSHLVRHETQRNKTQHNTTPPPAPCLNLLPFISHLVLEFPEVPLQVLEFLLRVDPPLLVLLPEPLHRADALLVALLGDGPGQLAKCLALGGLHALGDLLHLLEGLVLVGRDGLDDVLNKDG